ncbi:taste receptor type 1 member 1-like [Rhincodon typus]|uniref:taste receptor type 1 member 1-like n=1 Tax=Rhincodon typus TaxID=259920 RepID=UPI002030B388|nr:taste receptor type 1 member 1-like [Rhincodon typus]
MRFAIEEINNSSSLLPNVTLGYEIFDDCAITIDIQGSFAFVSKPSEHAVKTVQFDHRYQPLASVLIGPLKSDAAVITSNILSLLDVPQISYGASSEQLSDKTEYPNFMRTIPNDENQIEAIILLIQKFRWNWITVIGSSSDYGEIGKRKMISGATAVGICVASYGTIPQHELESKQEIINIIHTITANKVNVIVVFADVHHAEHFFQEVVAMNITGKVWILSEAMSVKRTLSQIPNIKRIGTILGIAIMQGHMPGYDKFVLRDIIALNSGVSQSIKYSEKQRERRDCPDNNFLATCNQCIPCTTDGVKSLLQYSEWRIEFNVYSAVYAAAHSLHQLLQCDSGNCKKESAYPWQLLKTLKTVNFSLNGVPISFDENGNPPTGYDIIYWDWKHEVVSFNVIGSYKPKPGRLQIDSSLIKWNSPEECIPCNPNQWSPSKSTICHNRYMVYLRWNENISIVIALATGIGLVLKVLIGAIFVIYFDTPIVKAAGGKLCFVLLLALAFSCSSVYSFIGEPSPGICITRKLLFTVSYTTCLACLLVRSFQLVLIFKMASKLPKAYSYWVKYNGQYIFVFIMTVIEITSFFIWIIRKIPVFERINDISQTESILTCGPTNFLFSLLSFCGPIFLCLLCFMVSYLSKDLPKNYNEAKYITFSMAVVLISWIFLFLVIFSSPNSFIPCVEAAVVLLNTYSITVGYFLPKCYIILLKPERNTTAFFQTCIQQYTRNRVTPQP